VFTERASVGLDVHARSVVAAAIDGVTGELIQTRLNPAHKYIRCWLEDLAAPVAVGASPCLLTGGHYISAGQAPGAGVVRDKDVAGGHRVGYLVRRLDPESRGTLARGQPDRGGLGRSRTLGRADLD
jgi:hypothetical protein